MLREVVEGLPDVVEVKHTKVKIKTSWRRALAAELLDTESAHKHDFQELALFFGYPLPAHVEAHPQEALSAVREWRAKGLETINYYSEKKHTSHKRVFDFDADMAIIVADFQRFYSIDLMSSSLHWWHFCMLLLSLMRTEGSLVASAISARSPKDYKMTKEQRKEERARARAWALPPTDNELQQMILDKW